VCASAEENDVSDRERPNLLYILSDQHNPSVTGCYGDPLVQTPNLDALAASGMVFDNAYCTAPLCAPSRMSMLAGQHPHQIGVWTNQHILDSAIPTFAHALGAVGYHPTLIGRMHSVGSDQLHGYAERLVGDLGSHYAGVGGRFDRGALTSTVHPKRASLELSGSGQSGYQVYDEYVTAETINYLNRLGLQKKYGHATDPFCLSVGLLLPHPPYVALREDYDLYRGRMTMPKCPGSFSEDLHPFMRWWWQQAGIAEAEATDEEIIRARTAYWALVTRMDKMIGRIISALHANDLADNTMIVYMSDHGDQLGEHGFWWKHTFYEGSVRIPAMISWPGVVTAGQRCSHVVSSLDVMATMLDALEAPTLPHSNGRSLLDLIRSPDKDVAWTDEAFSESCTDDGWYARMIRKDKWKLNYYHGYEPQLFDLETDPTESRDLARDAASGSILRELEDRVLLGWDPERIAHTMATKREDAQVTTAWAQSVKPQDYIRWDLKPDQYYLDE